MDGNRLEKLKFFFFTGCGALVGLMLIAVLLEALFIGGGRAIGTLIFASAVVLATALQARRLKLGQAESAGLNVMIVSTSIAALMVMTGA